MGTIMAIIYPGEELNEPDRVRLAQQVFGTIPAEKPAETKEVLYTLNSFFPSLNKIIGSRLRSLIFSRELYAKTGSLVMTPADSKVLRSRVDTLLLPLVVPQIQPNSKLSLLFSASEHGFSFSRMANGIKYYNADLLMVFSHTDPATKVIHTFAVFNEGEAKDVLKFASGNVGNVILELFPRIKLARATGGKGGHNYCYLNSRSIDNSDYKRGLGFGGSLKKFRLWIDGDFPDGCYLGPIDDTYEIKQFLEFPELNVCAVKL